MKITLEINTANEQDIVDAINSLNSLIPKENVLIEGATYTTEKLLESSGGLKQDVNFDILSEIELNNADEEKEKMQTELSDCKDEIANLKEIIETLKKDKLELKKEKDNLSTKVLNLETEINSVPDIPEFNNVGSTDNTVSKQVIEEYENKIEALTKQVAFHEGRSNKNFDEVKKLRNVVDTISSEKRQIEKQVEVLKKELDASKAIPVEVVSDGNNETISALESKINNLEKNKEKLLKEIDFQKNRNKTNWDEIKSLKQRIEDLEAEKNDLILKAKELSKHTADANSKEDIDKLKTELVQLKAEYEGTISELRVTNDKIQNEINLYKTKYSDEMIEEWKYLKSMKKAICSYNKGATFWNNVATSITKQ